MQVAQQSEAWEGLLIVTPTSMPAAMVKAFLDGGALGVVCLWDSGVGKPSSSTPDPTVDPTSAARFFGVFYRGVLRGDHITEALHAAGW